LSNVSKAKENNLWLLVVTLLKKCENRKIFQLHHIYKVAYAFA